MSLSPEERTKIESLIQSQKVFLFMKGNRSFPQCGFSATVVKILGSLVPEFGTFNVLSDPSVREGIKQYANWPTIPQLYVNGEFVGGCDIVKDMYASGELARLLGVDPAATPKVEVPKITVTDAARQVLAQAMAESGELVHVRISPRFENDLTLGPKEPGEIEVRAGELALYLDADSAGRAKGLVIDFVSEGGAQGFKITNPSAPPEVKALAVRDLKAALDRRATLRLIDVRTPAEWQTAHIGGAELLNPDLERELQELPKDTYLVFHCHHGGRSMAAAQRFAARGFSRCHNLSGGIDAWSLEIDSGVPRY